MEDQTMYLTRCNHQRGWADLFNEVAENRASQNNEVFYKPAANVVENEKDFEINLLLPGFTKEEISLKVDKNELIVEAGHENKENKETKYSWAEFNVSAKFRRAFILPEDVNVDGIKADFSNGILNITLPKNEEKTVTAKEIVVS